jgi:hypothetical protein
MFSSIDIFDVFPLSTFYHRLNWRVLVNGSSSPWVSLVHDSNADGDVWVLRLRLRLRLRLLEGAPPASQLQHAHLRVISHSRPRSRRALRGRSRWWSQPVF